MALKNAVNAATAEKSDNADVTSDSIFLQFPPSSPGIVRI